MKEIVSKIRKRIITIWIALIFLLRIFKNIILIEMDKINLYIFKRNMINAVYQCCLGLIGHDIYDANEVINLYIKLTDEIKKY